MAKKTQLAAIASIFFTILVISFFLALGLIMLALLKRYLKKIFSFVTYDQEWNPRGKVVAITGASSGIGAELGRQYSLLGAKVVLCARRNEELQQVALSCNQDLYPVRTIVGDVSKEEDCQAFVDFAAAENNGTIDCLILNAGISMAQDFDTLADTQILRKLMEVNYFGTVSTLLYALKYLKKSTRPKVVVVSSAAGKFATPTRTGYSASKFALHGFFEAWRCEASPKYGVEVTMVCPGVVNTDINRTRLSSGDISPGVLDSTSGMPVEQAARIIIRSVAKGERECLMTPEQYPGLLIKFFVPEVVDWLLLRKIRQISSASVKKTDTNENSGSTPGKDKDK